MPALRFPTRQEIPGSFFKARPDLFCWQRNPVPRALAFQPDRASATGAFLQEPQAKSQRFQELKPAPTPNLHRRSKTRPGFANTPCPTPAGFRIQTISRSPCFAPAPPISRNLAA